MQALQEQVTKLQAQLAQTQEQVAQLQAQAVNQRLRAWHGRTWEMSHELPLEPLAKEQPSPAGAAHAAPVGAFPPPGLFPATWAAVTQVGAGQGATRA